MKLKTTLLVFLLICCISTVLANSQSNKTKTAKAATTVSAEIRAAAHAAATTGCDASLWQHVYHRTRLNVVEHCVAVTGTIHHIKREADGDDHIQIKVDPEFEKLLNDRNKTAQAGSLIVEPVCEGPVTQLDAVAACKDFHSPVRIPSDGQHVKILGSFVLDTEANHGWTEIHPVTSITK